ncbi:MAG: hypothetical protein AAF581_07925 [Planctomycetota bacterium]
MNQRKLGAILALVLVTSAASGLWINYDRWTYRTEHLSHRVPSGTYEISSVKRWAFVPGPERRVEAIDRETFERLHRAAGSPSAVTFGFNGTTVHVYYLP